MKKYYILAVATLALAACSNDDNYIDEPVAARISATIGNSGVSRASETSWDSNDAIGVTMAEDRYVNLKYVTSAADGNFTGTTTMYFKNKRESVTLAAYYPFAGTEGTSPAIIETYTRSGDQTREKQAEFDFLYDVKTVTGAEPNVKFTFSHKMSKLTLIFKNGNGADVSKINSCTIEGLILAGTFNPVSGECAAKSGVGVSPENLSINLTGVTVADGTPLNPLIIFPQAIGDKVRLKITDSDEQDYSCDLTFEDNNILSGRNYQYTIKVNKTGLTVEQSTINEWETKKLETETSSE